MTSFNYSLSLQAAALVAFPLAYPFFTRSTERKMSFFSGYPPIQPPGLRRLIAMQVMLPANGLLQGKIKQLVGQERIHLKERIAIAYFSGTATVIASNPFEVALVKAQKEGVSLFHAVKSLYRERGFKALFFGCGLASIRHSIFITHLFAVYPHVQKNLRDRLGEETLLKKIGVAFASALVPGFLSCTLTQPLDVVIFSRQLNVRGALQEVIQQIYQLKGLSGFFVGYPYRLTGTCIQMASFNAALVYFQTKTKFTQS